MQSQFQTIDDIIKFLELFNFDNLAIIEVVRQCYFTREEKRLFHYYPAYLNGRNQNEIGLEVDKNQPKVSYYFKLCINKIKFFQQMLARDIVIPNVQLLKNYLNSRQYQIFSCLLAGKSSVSICSLFNCNKSNICQIRDTCLKNLKKKAPETYNWALAIFRKAHIIKK